MTWSCTLWQEDSTDSPFSFEKKPEGLNCAIGIPKPPFIGGALSSLDSMNSTEWSRAHSNLPALSSALVVKLPALPGVDELTSW